MKSDWIKGRQPFLIGASIACLVIGVIDLVLGLLTPAFVLLVSALIGFGASIWKRW